MQASDMYASVLVTSYRSFLQNLFSIIILFPEIETQGISISSFLQISIARSHAIHLFSEKQNLQSMKTLRLHTVFSCDGAGQMLSTQNGKEKTETVKACLTV